MDLLVPRLRDLPVLVIVTYRPEYTPALDRPSARHHAWV